MRLIIILFLLGNSAFFCQSHLSLSRRPDLTITTNLRLKHLFNIKTDEALFPEAEITGYSDSTLTIKYQVSWGDSVMRIISYPNPAANDTIYDKQWYAQTVSLLYSQVLYLEELVHDKRVELSPYSGRGNMIAFRTV